MGEMLRLAEPYRYGSRHHGGRCCDGRLTSVGDGSVRVGAKRPTVDPAVEKRQSNAQFDVTEVNRFVGYVSIVYSCQ